MNAARNFCWMASSVRCGVSHFCFPLNLPLHCQITLRYLLLECHIHDEKDAYVLAVEIASLTRRQQRGRGLRMA